MNPVAISPESVSTAAISRLLVVEDDAILRAHIVASFADAPDLQVVGEAGDVEEALARLVLQPDLIVLDLGLPDGNGAQIIQAVRAAGVACRILVLTVFDDRESVLGALRAGADGYLLKESSSVAMQTHVRATLAGETPISARAASHLLSVVREDAAKEEGAAPSFERLSPRERELLEHLARGLSRKEAARAMGISPNTVAEYVQGIYQKLHVRSRGRAVFEALQARLIKVDGN